MTKLEWLSVLKLVPWWAHHMRGIGLVGPLAYLFALPALFAAPPQVPITVSKETTFITEPLAGDGLPNYALAIQERMEKCEPAKNGAIPFWQAIGQRDMSDEEFERLSRKIGLSPEGKVKPLVPLEDKATIQAVMDWLRETGRSADDEELAKLAEKFIDWVQANPWTGKDVPPLAQWLAENEHALDLLVEASDKPEFYSPYPNLLVDRTQAVIDIKLYHAEALRRAARALMARAMYHLGSGGLEAAWSDCRACIDFGNHLAQGPILVEQLVAIALRAMGLRGVHVILSQPDLSPELTRRMLRVVNELERSIDITTTFDSSDRLFMLDYILRMTTGRLGGISDEEEVGEDGLDLNVSLGYINERFDQIVHASRVEDRRERMKQLRQLDEEFAGAFDKLKSFSVPGIVSQTYRSNWVAEVFFSTGCPAFLAGWGAVDRNQQFSALTKTALALAIHKMEHGNYPASLSKLSPAIMLEVPVDLYSEQPLQYKPMTEGFLLYSVFDNGVDDGATDVYGEIRNGEWHADKREIDRNKCDLVIRIPVIARPKP